MSDEDTTTKELIMRWIERAQVDYSDLYARLYIAYNAWFRKVTRTSFDREAISRLTKRFIIWDDYLQGRVLQTLKPLHKEIAEFTQAHTHKVVSLHRWSGIVKDESDWQGLIRYWYRVRCDLFHGSSDDQEVSKQRVRLAYASLNIFMLEITKRMDDCFTSADLRRLNELNVLLAVPSGSTIEQQTTRQMLHQKYIRSHDIWSVDLVRA